MSYVSAWKCHYMNVMPAFPSIFIFACSSLCLLRLFQNSVLLIIVFFYIVTLSVCIFCNTRHVQTIDVVYYSHHPHTLSASPITICRSKGNRKTPTVCVCWMVAAKKDDKEKCIHYYIINTLRIHISSTRMWDYVYIDVYVCVCIAILKLSVSLFAFLGDFRMSVF